MIPILSMRWLEYGERQNPIVPATADSLLVDVVLELEQAGELAVRPLAEMRRSVGVAWLQLAAALDPERSPLREKSHVRVFDSRQVDVDDERLLVFANVHRRIPLRPTPGAVDQFLEERVNLVLVKMKRPAAARGLLPAYLNCTDVFP